jgi:hypothetical protein
MKTRLQGLKEHWEEMLKVYQVDFKACYPHGIKRQLLGEKISALKYCIETLKNEIKLIKD